MNTLVRFAMILSGLLLPFSIWYYINYGYKLRQASYASKICEINAGPFFLCFQKIFPIGSSYKGAKKFLLDSGLAYQPASPDNFCNRFEWNPGNLDPSSSFIDVFEKDDIIIYVRTNNNWAQYNLKNYSYINDICLPESYKKALRDNN